MIGLINSLLVFLAGSSLATLISYLFLRPKTRAEAAAKRAEGDNLDIQSQAAIIARWREYAGDLERRVKDLEEHRDASDRREHIVAIFVYQASGWMRRAWDLMSPAMKETTGEPPTPDPQLFDGLHSPATPRPANVQQPD